jgi:hypothetical protein
MKHARKYWIMAAATAGVAAGLLATAIFAGSALGQNQAQGQPKDQAADYHAAKDGKADQETDYKAAKDKSDQERKQYADKVHQTYNFRFGKDNLFTPGTMQVEGDDFVQPGAFPNAAYCAHCHQEAYSQWRQALHSNAFRTPFYRASVNILINTKGIEFARHCDSCHNPIAVMAGGLTEDSKVDRYLPFHSEAAVDQGEWRFCHGHSLRNGRREGKPHPG